MSRSEIHVGYLNRQPTPLRNWIKENVPSPTIIDAYEESFRLGYRTPLRNEGTYMANGELILLEAVPVLGPGYKSFYMTVGDSNEANLVAQGLIPSQENSSTLSI